MTADATARPDPGPDMRRLADEFVAAMGELGWSLDFSEQSLETLEEMIDNQFSDWRPWRRGKAAKKNVSIASLVGAYTGEVMVRHLGARWGWMPEFDVAAVRLPSGMWNLAANQGAEALPQRQGGRSRRLLRGVGVDIGAARAAHVKHQPSLGWTR
jgi:hypothetical protein